MRHDYLQIIDAAYGRECSEAAWLMSIAAAVHKVLDQGLGAYVVRYDCRHALSVPVIAESGVSAALLRSMAATRKLFSTSQVARVYDSSVPIATLTSALQGDELRPGIWASNMLAHGVGDFLMIRAGEASRTGVIIGIPLAHNRTTPGPRTLSILAHVAVDLLAAWRVRRRLAAALSDAMATTAFDQIHNLGTQGTKSTSHVQTRESKAIERWRGRQLDRIETFQARDAVVRGDMSVIRRGSDSAGNIILLARRSARSGTDPARLSAPERDVAIAAAAGLPLKVIALELGVTSSTTSEHLDNAMRKLHLTSRSELTAFLFHTTESGDGDKDGVACGRCLAVTQSNELRACSFHISDNEYTLFIVNPMPRLQLDELTPAERHIVSLILGGATNAQIARIRGTKPQTVANQLRSIFDKLAVSSRAHLAAGCVLGIASK